MSLISVGMNPGSSWSAKTHPSVRRKPIWNYLKIRPNSNVFAMFRGLEWQTRLYWRFHRSWLSMAVQMISKWTKRMGQEKLCWRSFTFNKLLGIFLPRYRRAYLWSESPSPGWDKAKRRQHLRLIMIKRFDFFDLVFRISYICSILWFSSFNLIYNFTKSKPALSNNSFSRSSSCILHLPRLAHNLRPQPSLHPINSL